MNEDSSASSRGSQRRRVLMVAACPFPARRGTPVRIERMAEELGRRGHQVHVATYHLGDPVASPHITVHRSRDVPGYRQTAPGPNWRKLLLVDPRLQSTVYRLTRELRPDIIHAHHFEGLLVSLPARYRYRTPLVFDAHVLLDGELEYYEMGMPGTLRRRLARTMDRLLPRAADHVISVSEEIRDRLQGDYGMRPGAVTVIPNGVEAEFFQGAAGAFPGDGLKRIVFAGNLAKYQGIDYLLQAFRIVLETRRDVRLVMVTESPTEEFAREAAVLGLLDWIELAPSELSRLPSQLASADVLVNPRTRCPGVPQKLLNYMAAGTPIVSFEGSTRYIVDGRSGIVVANEDVRAFASGILRLLADPAAARQFGREAQDFARKSLSWSATAVMIEGVYDQMLQSRARRRPAP